MKSLALDSSEYEQQLYWVAQYHDGSIYKQQNINYASLDKKSIHKIFITDKDDNIIITQYFTTDQLPVYRARTVMKEGVGPIDRIHILGWLRKTQNDESISHMMYIFESDKHIEVGTINLLGNPYTSPITLMPDEELLFHTSP